jgi:hypothetical protein
MDITDVLVNNANTKHIHKDLLNALTEYYVENVISSDDYITMFNKIYNDEDTYTQYESIIQKIKSCSYRKYGLINILPSNIIDNTKQDHIVDLFSNDIIDRLNISLSADQHKLLHLLYSFSRNNKNRLCVNGYAGTGKTTIVIEFIKSLISQPNKTNKLKVIFSTKTHKALNVMHAKFKTNFKKISKNTVCFLTLDKMLNYEHRYNINGDHVFIKNNSNTIDFSKYNYIVIDESSMIPQSKVDDIQYVIEKNRKLKVVFIGDPNQLPPVNESPNTLTNSDYFLTDIVRTADHNLTTLYNNIRQWINGDKQKSGINDLFCKNIVAYNKQTQFDKWIDAYISSCENKNNILLTWTNEKSDYYNKLIRAKRGLNKIYQVGDCLIFNDFYNLPERSIDKRFYTSEQVYVNIVKKCKYTPCKFNVDISQEKIISKIISKINDYISSIEYNVYVLTINTSSNIIVLFNNETYKYNHDIEHLQNVIKDIAWIDNNEIDRLWNEYYKCMVKPFATVSYGYSITVHKSQSSTYYNVFIDLDNIFTNANKCECKRLIYTGFTRASHSIHILC